MLLPGEGLVLFLSVLLVSAPDGGTILEVQPAFEYWCAAATERFDLLRWLAVSRRLCLDPHREFNSSVLGSWDCVNELAEVAPIKLFLSSLCCMDDEYCLDPGLMIYVPDSLVLTEAPEEDSTLVRPEIEKKCLSTNAKAKIDNRTQNE